MIMKLYEIQKNMVYYETKTTSRWQQVFVRSVIYFINTPTRH